MKQTRPTNFITAINRAVESFKATGYDPNNHFRGVTKMVKLGSGAERAIEDFMLLRLGWSGRDSGAGDGDL